jgi:hypothetical protein
VNFDIGEVLTHAWQITWRNKVLWAINVLPFLITFLFFPVWFYFLFTTDFNANRILRFMEDPVFVAMGVVFYLVIITISLLLQVVSRASVTLGAFRAATDDQSLAFISLLKDGFKYFWRVLGVFALINAALIVLFLVFFACMILFSAVTMGLGALCFQPLFLLLIPLSVLVMTFLEQAESAIIADELGVMDAVRRAYELIRANLGKYVLITIVIYLGTSLLTSLVFFPVMIPMFFFMLRNMDANMGFSSMMHMEAIFGIVIFPIMALVQGFTLTYLKSAMMVTYLRLTRLSGMAQPAMEAATT